MATKFLEPGGDSTFNIAVTNNGGFYRSITGAPVLATDFVNASHIKSIQFRAGASADSVNTPLSIVSDAGARLSVYVYFVAFPASTRNLVRITASGGVDIVGIAVTTGGVLQLTSSAQIGTNGPTLSTGQWYRISLAYTITSSTVNRFELFKDGASAISVTNATLNGTASSTAVFGNGNADSAFDFRISDIYFDDSSSLTDTGNIFVTAKRPFSNGTLNEWTTQIGSGGSGYGSGHSSQVNERALSTVNGWSFQDTVKRTEEYTIEAASVGDTDLTTTFYSIVDFMGWVYAKVGVASTGNIIVAGIATNISLLTNYGMFTVFAGSTIYPTGNNDIGIDNNTINQLFSLAECGIMVAYIPGQTKVRSGIIKTAFRGSIRPRPFGPGLAR